MYLDPGFGGMLIQIIVGIAAFSGAIAFSFRKKIRDFFSKDKDDAQINQLAQNIDDSEDEVIDMLSDDDLSKE